MERLPQAKQVELTKAGGDATRPTNDQAAMARETQEARSSAKRPEEPGQPFVAFLDVDPRSSAGMAALKEAGLEGVVFRK